MLGFLATAIGTIVIIGLAVNGIVKPSANDRVKELTEQLASQEKQTEDAWAAMGVYQTRLQECVAATEECFSFHSFEWCSKTGRHTK